MNTHTQSLRFCVFGAKNRATVCDGRKSVPELHTGKKMAEIVRTFRRASARHLQSKYVDDSFPFLPCFRSPPHDDRPVQVRGGQQVLPMVPGNIYDGKSVTLCCHAILQRKHHKVRFFRSEQRPTTNK